MNLYFVEEDLKLFVQVKNTVEQCLDKVNVLRAFPKELISEKFNPEPHSLVLLDLDCSDFNGLALFDAIHRQTNAPIVVLDDINTGGNRLIKALHMGASEYLFKPISNSHLISTVITHLKVGLVQNPKGGIPI
jgi:DNA-binding response OmpR family regulator